MTVAGTAELFFCGEVRRYNEVLQKTVCPSGSGLALHGPDPAGRGSRPAPARLLERLLWYFTFFLTLWCTAHSLISVSLDFRHLYLAAALAGGWTFCCDRREVQHRTLRRLLFWLGWLPGMAAYLFILRSTLIALCTTFMYLFWPALCGAAALALKSPAAPHRRKTSIDNAAQVWYNNSH